MSFAEALAIGMFVAVLLIILFDNRPPGPPNPNAPEWSHGDAV
jgi:hypothetical protein